MSAEERSGDDDHARWESVEAETRDRLEAEAREADGAPEAPTADWDADTPSWWQDPEADDPLDPRGPDPDADSPQGPGVDGVAPRILLADADPAIAASIEQAMVNRGWIVRHVVDGELALAEFRRLAPDCFVFDFSLPGMGGLDLLRRLSESGVGDETRLVVNSVQTQAILVHRARALGVHRFLDRPLRSPDKLVDAVAEQLDELGVLGGAAEGRTAREPAGPTPGSEPVDLPRPPGSAPGGLFADRSPGPPPEAEDPTEPPPPAPPKDTPVVQQTARSSFGRGGGPPGRIPKLK